MLKNHTLNLQIYVETFIFHLPKGLNDILNNCLPNKSYIGFSFEI